MAWIARRSGTAAWSMAASDTVHSTRAASTPIRGLIVPARSAASITEPRQCTTRSVDTGALLAVSMAEHSIALQAAFTAEDFMAAEATGNASQFSSNGNSKIRSNHAQHR